MVNPFTVLQKTLESVFHEPTRKGKCIYPEIQRLEEAIQNYHPSKKNTFVVLIRALREALPHLEKRRIHFDSVRKSIDSLATKHQMPAIDWDKFLTHPQISPRFQFNTQQDTDLIPWLTATSGEIFSNHSLSVQTQILIAYRNQPGFSQKLSAHLKKDPKFLSQLVMESENNFIQILSTRLILYLTDEQIATAIIKYLPNLSQKHQNPLIEVKHLVNKLNDILSHGRSLSTLLRNVKAKSILEESKYSKYFKIYQSDEYKNSQERASFSEEKKQLKPKF